MTDEPLRKTYAFAEFRLDALKRVLLREGKAVPLNSKAFDLLLLLVFARTSSVMTCLYSHAGARQRMTRASQRKGVGTRASAPAPSSSSVPASNRRTSGGSLMSVGD